MTLYFKFLFLPIGDFHFLWECVIFLMFGNHGSLSSIRDHKQVDKGVKVFKHTGDEFLVHTFKAHLVAYEKSLWWLQATAERLLPETIMPANSTNPVYAMH